MLYEVGEDEAVEPLHACRVEGLVVHSRCCVDEVEGIWEKVCRNNYIVILKISRPLDANIIRIDYDINSRVEVPDLWCRRLSPVFPNILRRDEELCAQIPLRDYAMVDYRKRVDACQHEVLCDFIRECSHADEEDVGIPDLLLGLDAPEPDLTVVQGNLVWCALDSEVTGKMHSVVFGKKLTGSNPSLRGYISCGLILEAWPSILCVCCHGEWGRVL
jgi:hypothetical protein